MSKHFVDIAVGIVEHGLIRKGIAKPSRVWQVDKETGKRTLLVDNSKQLPKIEKGQKSGQKAIKKRLHL